MGDDGTPRVTLRGEFLRAERHLARAVEAETRVERLTALADCLAARIARVEALAEAAKDFDEVGMGWVSVSEIFAALDGFPPSARTEHPRCKHPNHGSPDHDCAPFGQPS